MLVYPRELCKLTVLAVVSLALLTFTGFGSSGHGDDDLTGGVERTAREFASLLARAELTMTRGVPTTTGASIVEAQPV